MAFLHQDGLVAAWTWAVKYAGEGGRLATLPDIVVARINDQPGVKGSSWEAWYTTVSAEYYGKTRSGRRILIVAHGVGPMSTLDGAREAYRWEYGDTSRNHRGGRISQDTFWDLEAGKFGPVEIVDFDAYCRRYEFSFGNEPRRKSQALSDPLLRARLGSQSEEYLNTHARHACAWHAQMGDSRHSYEARLADPFIVEISGASNCWYPVDARMPEVEDGMAMAHLLSTGALCHVHFADSERHGHEALANDVGCCEWWNTMKLVGIRQENNISDGILAGPDAYWILRKHWQELFLPAVKNPPVIGLRALMQIGDQWFTQYPKAGESMDTWEPEYVVTTIESVGQPVEFRTTGCESMFFRFGVNEVEAIAPAHANAYLMGEPRPDGDDHIAPVQFYRITADTTRRLLRAETLNHNLELMMRLMQQ